MTTDPKPPPARRAAMIAGAGLLLITAMVCGVHYLRPAGPNRSSFAERLRSDLDPNGGFIGSRSCRECHPGASASHARSGHARTLRPAARLPLAKALDGRAVTDPERPGVRWSYALRGGRFEVERTAAGEAERFLLDYALGSGHHATTFVTLTDPAQPTALEHRLTYYTRDDALGVTPGQRAARPSPGTTPHGRELTPRDTLKCFGCHATRLSSRGRAALDVDEIIPNVSCERCHGPARAHVAAARAGRSDLAMPFGPGRWTAWSQAALCGQCHRHPSNAPPGMIRSENTALARFQPVGMLQSKCYTESRGAFSCVTCHDPHARTSTDRAGYEAACLSCHGPAPRTACPVSPRTGCIGCHMPKVNTGQRVLFTDHWIRTRHPSDPRADAPSPALSSDFH